MTHWTERALSYIRKQTFPRYVNESAPTVRELARRYRVPQQEVINELEDNESVCMNVGLQIGNGIHEHECIGDYNFEWMGN